MTYIGNPPQYQAFPSDSFSGTGSQTAFTMSVVPANAASVLVGISNALIPPSAYTVVGNTLTFISAPAAGTNNISVRYLAVPATNVGIGVSSVSGSGNIAVSPTTGAVGVTFSGVLAANNGGTGNTTNTAASVPASGVSGVLALANGGTNNTTGAATAITNASGWSVTPSGTKLYFNYNGSNVASLDSAGNLICLANVTAYGTP